MDNDGGGRPDRLHSISPPPVSITGPDSVIIADELDELDNIEDEVTERKKDVIIRAAEKLAGKYRDDVTVVAARLANVLARDRQAGGRTIPARVSRRWLYDVLPSRYKRPNQMIAASQDALPHVSMSDTVSTGTTPSSSLYEPTPQPPVKSALADFCDLLGSAAQQTAALCQIMAREARTLYETDPDLRDAVEADGGATVLEGHESVLMRLCGAAQFSSLVPVIRDISDTAEAAKSLLDRRQRFGTAARMGLQVAFLTHSYAEMAARISGHKYGGKWMAHIDDDDATRKFAQVYRCPACGLDAQLYIEKYKRAYERGDSNMPEIHEFCEGVRKKMGKKKK